MKDSPFKSHNVSVSTSNGEPPVKWRLAKCFYLEPRSADVEHFDSIRNSRLLFPSFSRVSHTSSLFVGNLSCVVVVFMLFPKFQVAYTSTLILLCLFSLPFHFESIPLAPLTFSSFVLRMSFSKLNALELDAGNIGNKRESRGKKSRNLDEKKKTPHEPPPLGHRGIRSPSPFCLHCDKFNYLTTYYTTGAQSE